MKNELKNRFVISTTVKVERQSNRDKKMSDKMKERHSIEILKMPINDNYRKKLNVLLIGENEEFRVWSIICQASKQASKHSYGKLYCNKLEKKPLWNSCSFKKIVNKVSTPKVFKGGKTSLWFFGPWVSFVPFFYSAVKNPDLGLVMDRLSRLVLDISVLRNRIEAPGFGRGRFTVVLFDLGCSVW